MTYRPNLLRGWLVALIIAADLGTKALFPTPELARHYVTVQWQLTLAALVLPVGYVAYRYPAARLAASLAVAAIVGNLGSSVLWGYVPNPFGVEWGGFWLCFNTADLAIWMVVPALLVSASVVWRGREQAA